MKIIYNKILPFKGFAAMNLFGIILAREECKPLSRVTINHEAKIHMEQMKELLFVGFYLWYIIEWFIKLFIYGKEAYRNISFEREAYAYEGYEGYLTIRKRYNWIWKL